MLSMLRRDCSPLCLRDSPTDGASILLRLWRDRGGGGGAMDARLLFVMSRLRTDEGLPEEECRDVPRAGGGAGNGAVDGDDNGEWCEELEVAAGRRDGGGGGTLALLERGRPVSNTADISLSRSSTLGETLTEVLRARLESGIRWLCRRLMGGAGGVFRFMGGNGEVGSGIFPAASLSKIDSRSESLLARFGAGGRGLLRSDCEGVECRGLVFAPLRVVEALKGWFEEFDGPSSRSSTVISFPCLELGG